MSTPIAIGPEHPMFYAELFYKKPRPAKRRLPLIEKLRSDIPTIQIVDNPLIKRLQTLLDVVADISHSQQGNVSATMVSLTENKGTLETKLFLAFNHNDQAARSCSSHLESIFKILGRIPYMSSPEYGSPNLISSEFESNIVEIAKVLHDYSFQIFAYRVKKRQPKLLEIRGHIERDRIYFTPEKRYTLLRFFRDLGHIINIVAQAEATKTIPAKYIKLLLKIYDFWTKKNLLPDHGSADTSITLLDEADYWLETEHQIGFQLRRWARKIMSFVISANKLFTLTQSPRLRHLLKGRFSVQILGSESTTPYHCDLSSATVRKALDAALGTDYQGDEWNVERDTFVSDLQEESVVIRRTTKIHTELALLMAMAKGEIKDVMPYIGVSKLSCIMCNNYIRAYNYVMNKRISTKGSHGKAYPAWFWPSLPVRDEELRQAFLKEVRQELRDDFIRHVEAIRRRQTSENTVGSWCPGYEKDATEDEIEELAQELAQELAPPEYIT